MLKIFFFLVFNIKILVVDFKKNIFLIFQLTSSFPNVQFKKKYNIFNKTLTGIVIVDISF